MTEAEPSYDFDAPMHADLSGVGQAGMMSPGSQSWFDDQSRKLRGTKPTVPPPPPPPPPDALALATTKAPAAPKAWTPAGATAKQDGAAKPKPGEAAGRPVKPAADPAAAAPAVNPAAAKPAAAKPAAAKPAAPADNAAKPAAPAKPAAVGGAQRTPVSARAAPPAKPEAAAAPKPQAQTARESRLVKPTAASQAWTRSAPDVVAGAPTCSAQRAGAAPQRPPVLSTSRRGEGKQPTLSSEERELQEAAKEIEKAKEANAHRRAQLSKVLSSAGKERVPKRSTAELTVPDEFELLTARSDPGTPQRERPSMQPIAEQVQNFSKTPRRFRSRAAHATPSPMPRKADPRAFTRSMSFDLSTQHRARPVAVKSAAEREAEEMAGMPKFRAQPLNKKVLESAGDLGVPRVQRPAPTQFDEFRLSASNAPARAQLASSASEPQFHFKARAFNKQLMEGTAHGLAQVTPRKATRPRSPGLATDARAVVRAPAAPAGAPAEDEQFAAFKARPMPTFSPQRSPRPHTAEPRPITSPRPFALSTDARGASDEAARQRRLKELEEAEAKKRSFRARPMPVGEAWRPAVGVAPPTTPAPFELRSESRGALHESAWRQAVAQEQRAEKEQRDFHARGASVLKKGAFVAAKSSKPLTEINGFRIASTEQAEKRKQRELELAAERAAKLREEREANLLKQKQEAAQLVEYRRSLVQKARPASVLKKEPFKPQLGGARLTQAQSPHLRVRSRAVRAA